MLRFDGRQERKTSTTEAREFRDDVLGAAKWAGGEEYELTLEGIPYTVSLGFTDVLGRVDCMRLSAWGTGPFAELRIGEGQASIRANGREDSPQEWDDFVERMGW